MSVLLDVPFFATVPAFCLSIVRFGGIAFVVTRLSASLPALSSHCQRILIGLELCGFNDKALKFLQEAFNDIIGLEIDLQVYG